MSNVPVPAVGPDRQLRTLLRGAFDRRVAKNPRYSLRAFARGLGLHHSTLVRVLNGNRGLSEKRIRNVGRRLRLSEEDIRAIIVAEHGKKVLAVTHHPAFRPDARWVAVATGLDLDDVGRALHYLIHTRQLTLAGPTAWIPEDA